MQVAQPPTKTTGQRSESAERILQAARELFGRDGYDGTTIKQIADRCNLSDAAVLYHFRSKREILEAILVPPDLVLVPLPDEWEPALFARTLVDRFYAWEPHWALVRVLLVQALDDDMTSITFTRAITDAWRAMVQPALAPHCGEETDEIVEALGAVFQGILADRLIGSGDDFERVMGQPETRSLLERSVRFILPPAAETVTITATA